MLDTYSASIVSLISRNDANQTTGTNAELELSPYGYTPTFSVCILFLALFWITSFSHFLQAIWYRKWFFLYTAVFAGAIELTGWSGRLWSSRDVTSSNAYMVQIVCTIVAPTPLLAANFIILARIIRKLGEQYSRLRSRLYSRIFLSCDIIALFTQAGGGAIASGTDNRNQVNLGSNIMLGGIVFQLVVMVCYMILGTEFFWRHSRERPIRESKPYSKRVQIDGRIQLLIYALMFNTGCLFIRAIYRTIELADGFDGKVIQTQWLFNVFDATVVVLAMYAYNLAHLGRLLDESDGPFVSLQMESTASLMPTKV